MAEEEERGTTALMFFTEDNGMSSSADTRRCTDVKDKLPGDQITVKNGTKKMAIVSSKIIQIAVGKSDPALNLRAFLKVWGSKNRNAGIESMPDVIKEYLNGFKMDFEKMDPTERRKNSFGTLVGGFTKNGNFEAHGIYIGKDGIEHIKPLNPKKPFLVLGSGSPHAETRFDSGTLLLWSDPSILLQT